MAKAVKQHLRVDIYGKFGSEFNRDTFEKVLRIMLDGNILSAKMHNKKTEVSYLVTDVPISKPEDN